MFTFLLITWIIDGLGILYCLRQMAVYFSRDGTGAVPMAVIAAILLGSMGLSMILHQAGHPIVAAIVSGWPLLPAGVYGLFLMLVVSSKTRWN